MTKQVEGYRYRGKAGWPVQFACLLLGYSIFLTTFALIKTLGVLFIQLQMEYGASAAQASFTISLPSTVVFMGGPIYGAIFNIAGIKKTYACSSLLMFMGFSACYFARTLFFVQCFMCVAGFGAGLSNVTTLTLMGRAFYTSRPIAMAALAMGGATAGALIIPLLQLCVDLYSWKGALLILGAYTLHGMAFGFALHPVYNVIVSRRREALVARVMLGDEEKKMMDELKEEIRSDQEISSVENDDAFIEERNSSNRKQSSKVLITGKQINRRKSSVYDRFSALGTNLSTAFDLSLLKDPWFICYCIASGLSISSRILSGLYLVRYSQYVGLSDQEAAIKPTVCESIAFIVMPIVAIVTSVKKDTGKRKENVFVQYVRWTVSSIRSSYLLGVFQITMSIVIATSTALETNTEVTVYAAMLGFCYGGVTFLTNSVLADLFGTERLSGAVGYRSLSSGILFLSVPPIIGLLIDVTGTYDVAQYFTGTMTLIAGVLTIATQIALTRRARISNYH